MTTSEFLKVVRTARLKHKNQWYWVQETVNGKWVTIKAFNTCIQRMVVGNVRESGPLDSTVKQMNEFIVDMVELPQ